MNDDQLLFAAALAHPAEDTPRLALADWFDEHDEPELAGALGASREMIAFLAELTRWDAVPSRRVSVYENGAFHELFPTPPAARLLLRYGDLFSVPPGVPTEYVEDAPPPRAYGDPLNPATFLFRWQDQRQRQIAALRELAATCADNPSLDPSIFRAPAHTPEAFERRSCLLHELVLRRRGLSDFPGATEHAALMRERQHPLAWLPLALLPPDAELPIPHFWAGGWTVGAPSGGEALPIHSLDGAEVPGIITSESFVPESRLFAAVRGWANVSNGRLEGRAFHLDRPLASDAVGRLWFSRLPADSMTAALVTANWSVNRVTPGYALAVLFASAHNGGAYSVREWGAYARLHAWESLGVMTGCGEAADTATVADAAQRCEWITFSGTAWFNQIAWDLGLICVHPDRLTLALLAATDTD